MLVPLTAVCLAAAAHAYHLPPVYLQAILTTEGGHVGQAVQNKNGTFDLGPFQINSAWGPAIGQYWHVTAQRGLQHVRDNGCANAMIASAILKKYVLEAKGDFPKAIGFYHSHTKELAETYRTSVIATALKMSDPFRAPPQQSILTLPALKQPAWTQAAPKRPVLKQTAVAAQRSPAS